MKIGILTNEQYANAQKGSVGSSRIRCNWLLPYFPEAQEFRIGIKYDAIIFQKAYFTDYMKVYDGTKILDVCDPDWMDGKPVIEAAELCDAVTVSSRGLHDYLSKILQKPVYLIEDRVDPAQHLQKKVHSGRAQGAVWFGYHQNQQVLDAVLPTLKRLGLRLTVISDLPYFPSAAIQDVDKGWISAYVKNVKFDQETVNDEIIGGGDFVLNNRPDTGKFKYKSDNKTVIAWALGMPVAKTAEDVEAFLSEEARVAEAEKRVAEVSELWTSDISVRQYQDVIRGCQERKRAGESVPAVSGREAHI